jgi:hypothetical protein
MLVTTERIRKTSANELEDVITIHDPDYYTRDFQVRYTYAARNDVRLEDYVCGEPHRDINMIAGVARSSPGQCCGRQIANGRGNMSSSGLSKLCMMGSIVLALAVAESASGRSAQIPICRAAREAGSIRAAPASSHSGLTAPCAKTQAMPTRGAGNGIPDRRSFQSQSEALGQRRHEKGYDEIDAGRSPSSRVRPACPAVSPLCFHTRVRS